ncbi:hypothetical protein [Paenibacillus odorifer]|uniref:hypothetical protein n=1 Tax=Paenibacillus odorifer TaxID=189426 RepID=UPI0009701F69|nr:hypothetical protein [Paenibacillus odorifer]OME27747.1 hypothetical protein BSK57_03795 [Paenibacillus odorifer]
MHASMVSQTELTKEYRLSYRDRSVLIILRIVKERPEIQVDAVNYGIDYKKSFSEFGTFQQFLYRFLGTTFQGSRKKFIEDLYWGKIE